MPLTPKAECPGILDWAMQRAGAVPPRTPALDRAALNDAVDALLASGRDFTVRDLPAGMDWPEASQRLSKLRDRSQAELVQESAGYGNWEHPRVWRQGPNSRVSLAEAGRRGALARNGKGKL